MFTNYPKSKVRTLWVSLLCICLLVFLWLFLAFLSHGKKQSILEKRITNLDGFVLYDNATDRHATNPKNQDNFVLIKLRSVFGNAYFGNVKEICLSNVSKGTDLEIIQSLPRITHLTLLDGDVGPDSIKMISKMPNICSLDLARCNLSSEAVALFPSLVNIQELTLMSASPHSEIVKALHNIPELRYLIMAVCTIQKDNIQAFSKIPSLEYLEFYYANINPKDIGLLSTSGTLKTILLRKVTGITPKNLVLLKASLPLKSVIKTDYDFGF